MELCISTSKAVSHWSTGQIQPIDKFDLPHETFFKLSHYFYIKSGFLISLKQLEVWVTLDTHTLPQGH